MRVVIGISVTSADGKTALKAGRRELRNPTT